MGSPPETCSLDLLLKEERALVSAVKTEDNRDGRALRVRLNALGINLGKEVSIIRRAWLDGPILLRVNQATQVAIRRSEARCVIVTKVKADEQA